MRRMVLCLFVISAGLAGFTAPAGEKDEAAKEAFAQGKEKFKDGDFEGAASAFRRANELRPNWRILYNIGQSEAAAKRHGLALIAFESYLSKGGDDISESRLESVLEEVQRLRQMVGLVEVVAPEGAAVVIDEVERGTAPLSGQIPVAAGVEHEVVVTEGNEEIGRRKVKVLGGMTTSVEFSANEPEPKPDEAAASQDAEAKESDDASSKDEEKNLLKPLGWIAVGVGGAALIAGGITGGMAMSANSDIEDGCPGNECDGGYRDDIDRRDALALTTDILIPAGAVILATGVVLLIVDATSDDEKPSVALVPYAAPDGVGLGLGGRF